MSTRPNPPNHTSSSKTAPPPIHTVPGTLLHPSAALTGTHAITLGRNVIIQLRSRIFSTYSPVTIAENTIVSERASIGFLSQPALSSDTEAPNVSIGPGVLIESGAIVEAFSIGAYRIVEVGAKVGKGAVIGERCKICAMVEIGEGEVVGDSTVVYGNGWGERRVEEAIGLESIRKGMAESLGEVYRRNWTGK